MTALDATHVLVAGGALADGTDAGVRALDLTCTQSCGSAPGTQAWGPLPVALGGASVFDIDPARAFLVGSEPASGLTHTFLLTTAGATAVPTKVQHTWATAAMSPVGSVVLFGGASGGEMESFTPAP